MSCMVGTVASFSKRNSILPSIVTFNVCSYQEFYNSRSLTFAIIEDNTSKMVETKDSIDVGFRSQIVLIVLMGLVKFVQQCLVCTLENKQLTVE